MTAFDYEELGLVAGLEIHQQLDTATKLFCACPTDLREPESSTRRFTRYLHPTRSELGEVDEAALEESMVDREFEYLAFDSTCLVEEDEEPPGRLDPEALEATLQIAQLLDMSVVDEAHVMRKVVIDGSNTSGFQRTALVATDGVVETDRGPVSVTDLQLEEESAKRTEETEAGVRYGLDRLGIPLVEIGTGPDIETPEQARQTAERIGMLLRSTGRVKRGLGTIRQDVNVSIEAGSRVEMKGVQALEDIDDIVRLEVRRQVELLEVAEALRDRDASVGDPRDVTDVFADTDSGVIAGAEAVWAVPLCGFDGLLGRELQPDRRLGTELSDHAKHRGAGGIFHTDELPAYGVSEAEVDALRDAVGAGPADAVALVAADDDTAASAIDAVAARAAAAIEGVPEETRDVKPDATSAYLRPLPGAARMYPETDVEPVRPDPTDVPVPELLTDAADRYVEEYGLDPGLAEEVAFGRRRGVFEDAVAAGVDPTLAATTVESTVTELRRDGVPVEALAARHFREAFELVDEGEVPTGAIDELLTALADDPDQSAAAAAEGAGLGGADEAAVREAVAAVVERNADQVEAEGMGAFSALMGECMAELGGSAEGELVSDLLREEIGRRT